MRRVKSLSVLRSFAYAWDWEARVGGSIGRRSTFEFKRSLLAEGVAAAGLTVASMLGGPALQRSRATRSCKMRLKECKLLVPLCSSHSAPWHSQVQGTGAGRVCHSQWQHARQNSVFQGSSMTGSRICYGSEADDGRWSASQHSSRTIKSVTTLPARGPIQKPQQDSVRRNRRDEGARDQH